MLKYSIFLSTDICKLPKVVGPCRGGKARYYYDSGANECKLFLYGGCFGNDNRFQSEADCAAKCKQ